MPNTGQILIADDADSLLLPVTDMLRLEGYECNYVPDTNTVIEILKCIKFNLLIADINTVGSRELEAIKELSDYTNELSIILVADIPLSEAQIQSMKPLVTACLRKPLSIEELLQYVRCSIKGKLIGT
ncbi:MAG: response regulator [Candidatus Scalindua sp.]|nr:response regulator [Candidatus Scalindua sp.]